MNGADLIAGILKKEGIEFIPAFPHSDIIDCGAKLGIRPLIVRQERHALHIADGYARMTAGRKFCCTTVQYGPGSENAIGAVAQCFADNVPVLHMPGGYAREDQGGSPNYNFARNAQLVNKWCEMVLCADRIPQMMQNAFALLRNGRPGPVSLEVPIDIFKEDVDPALLDSYKPQRRSAPCADLGDLEELADAVLAARYPVIIAGQGILYAQATDELLELAELLDLPVISTLNGKSAFPENNPLSAGCAGGARPDGVNHALERADVVLGLGTSFTRSDYITPFPTAGRTFLQLTNWEGDISKDYPIDLGVIGDAKSSIAALIGIVKWKTEGVGRRRPEIRNQVVAEKKAFLDKWMPQLTSDEQPISPYRVVWDLKNTLDPNRSVLTHEAGSPRDQITPFYDAVVPHGYMGWGKTTQLGMSLGLMHGAKLAKPDWTCVHVMGDAAIGMTGMDFETAVRLKIGTITIVLKNSLMGGYKRHHPNAAKMYQIEELGGDYAAMARAFGGYAETITDPADLVPAYKRAIEKADQGIPVLLQVITKEELNMAKDLPLGVGPHDQV